MTALAPLRFQWDGDAMIPLNPRAADRQYVVGEVYNLEHREERSSASHAHYFAMLNECWQNLPDDLAERFPTSEHLRKYALIRTGYRDERSHVCSSKAEALRFAAFVRPMDDYAIVVPSESVVTVYTAKSQSVRAMGKKEFGESKTKVLDFCANLIGVPAENVTEAA
jgi:hypothetical protein